MAKLYVSNRQVVLPGDLLAEGDDILVDSIYIERMDSQLYSTITGLVVIEEVEDKVKLSIIPLEGVYIPRPGDIVIGLVEDIGITHWEVDINSPYRGILTVQEALDKPFNPASEDLRKYFDVGDYIIAKTLAFDRTRDPLLTVKGKGLGKVTEGLVIEVKPSRIPRIIGKKASMINMLISETSCNIIVGQNGRIIVDCPNKEQEDVAIRAIRMIEREAHTTGLTDRVKEFIRRELGKSLEKEEQVVHGG
ncbi:MAG: exosome complex RNA-binding protein Rrp4 [Pyrodictiaceae archaeon]